MQDEDAKPMGWPELHTGQAACGHCQLTSFSLVSYEGGNVTGHVSAQVIGVLEDSHRDLFTAESLLSDHA